MDESELRPYAEAHAKAVLANDMATLMADIDESAMAALGEVATALPSPVERAEVKAIEMDGGEATVLIRYEGQAGAATVRSRWAERGGRPKVIDARLD